MHTYIYIYIKLLNLTQIYAWRLSKNDSLLKKKKKE